MDSIFYKKFRCIEDETYKIHPASKALEGFLEKVIKGKDLKQDKEDCIGGVFGKKDLKVRSKIKDKRLIAKTKTVWDFCRNDIMHFSKDHASNVDVLKTLKDIEEIIILLYKDFYGKTEPDIEIEKGYKKYVVPSFNRKKKKS